MTTKNRNQTNRNKVIVPKWVMVIPLAATNLGGFKAEEMEHGFSRINPNMEYH
jgi:hypothetical protein